MINDKHRKENIGLTLKEKVDKVTNSKKARDTIEIITDSFFKETEVEGRHMYARVTNLHREGKRTMNIPDEEEEAGKALLAAEAEAEKTEMSYEQYLAVFEDHIEGKAPNNREPLSSSDEEFPVGGSPVKRAKKPVTPKVNSSKNDAEDAKS